MKKNYVSPVTEQVEIKLEKHLLDLSFDDTPAVQVLLSVRNMYLMTWTMTIRIE